MKTLTTLSLMGALALSSTAIASEPNTDSDQRTPSAAQQCRTERSAMGLELFRLTYGSNKNKRNAFGKCVSKRSHATHEAIKQARHDATEAARIVRDQLDADVTAAKACKAERDADPAAFAAKYGKNKNKRNAFGKCVSAQAKAQQDKS
jgi:hypothetical protein